MKKDWTIKKLGELCDFIGDGDWIESKDQSTKGIRLIQTGNIGNGIYLDKAHHAHFISEKTFSRLRCTEIFPGDCLISRLPDPVGRACIIPKAAEKMITAVDCTIIRFNKQIVPEYFVLYAQSNKYFIDIDSESTGATRKRISRKNLEKISVPLPPLEEQKRIVAMMDKKFAQIETLKTAAEKNLQNTKQLFQAELEKAFSNLQYATVQIKDITTKIGSGATPKGGKTSYVEEGISLIRSMNVYPFKFEYENLAHITDQQAKELQNVEIKQKDVLFNITGASIARCCVVPDDVLPARVNQHVSILRCKGEIINPDYLCSIMNSPKSQKILLGIGEAGSTRQALTKSDLENFTIPLPPLEEQKHIVAYLDSLSEKVHQLEEIYTKQLADCDELKQSLLQKAFEGEL